MPYTWPKSRRRACDEYSTGSSALITVPHLFEFMDLQWLPGGPIPSGNMECRISYHLNPGSDWSLTRYCAPLVMRGGMFAKTRTQSISMSSSVMVELESSEQIVAQRSSTAIRTVARRPLGVTLRNQRVAILQFEEHTAEDSVH